MTGFDIAPPPPHTLDVEPTDDDVRHFREHGYLVVERLTTDAELAWLTDVYEQIFDPVNADVPGAPVDRSGDGGTPLLGQAFFPEHHHPELLDTTFRRNARRFAAALLGAAVEELTCWGHMIRKLPGGREAPWHQDEAYWDPELSYHAVGCWLPLHDVTEEMGAMQFVRGSHRWGVLEHHHRDDDPVLHLLEADLPPDAEQVVCPLPAGGATFHDRRTLHRTAPNTTDRPRLAFPMEFEVMPVVRDEPIRRAWVDRHRAATGRGPATHHPADGEMVALVRTP